MTDLPKYDRPNTVADLVAKQGELSARRDKYKAEIKNCRWTKFTWTGQSA